MQTIKAASAISMMRSRLYGKGRARTPLFKAITGVLAAEMTLMGLTPAVMAANLPQSSAGYGAGMNVSGQKLTIDGAQGAGSSFTWDQGFNIGQGYTVQFQNIAAAVNKDTSGQLSSILGNLFSDGAVYILNPNGILFGPSAVVDVHGLIAAAVGSVGKGPDGEFVFSKLGSGNVVNQGSISAGDFAYLVGRSVENSGSISAANVALAAFGGTGADSITIASTESGAKITFQIPEGAIAEAGEDDGGEVAVSGTITGIQNEQAQNEGGARRAMASTPKPEEYKDGDDNINIDGRLVDNIAIYGADINIESDAIGKNVSISGTKGVTLGGGSAEKVFVKANDGNVDIVAGNYINVKGNADVSAVKGDTAEAADVTMKAGGNINMGGTITANDGTVTLKAGDETLNAVNADTKSVKIGFDGGEGQAAYNPNASILAKNISLEGNKSAQVLAGSVKATAVEGAGGKVTMTGNEYVAVNGNVMGKDVEIATTLDGALDPSIHGYSDRGVLQMSGAITADGGDVTIDSAGSVDLTGEIVADGKKVAIAANGANGYIKNNSAITAGTITLDGAKVLAGENGKINADNLALVGDSFGTSDGALSITAKTLAANVKNDIYVTKDGELTVGTVGDVTGVTAGGNAAIAATGALAVDKKIEAANVTLGGSSITAKGDITAKDGGTLTLNADFTQTAGTIEAGSVVADGKKITQQGVNAAEGVEPTLISAGTITAAQINQNGGRITATDKIAANVTQEGCEIVTSKIEGDLTQNDASDIATVGEITGAVTQNNGLIRVTNGDIDYSNLTIGGTLDQKADGTIDVTGGALTLKAASEAVGKITASDVVLEAGDADVALKGSANEIQAVGGTAKGVTLNTTTALEQKTLTATGKVDLDATGALTQSGALTATDQDVELKGLAIALSQNIDAKSVKLEAGTTQSSGTVTADEVVLAAAGADVTLAGADNAIQKVGGSAAAVTLNTTSALEVNALATAGGNTTLDAGANLVTFKGANSAANYTLKSNAKVADGSVTATTKIDAKTADKEIEVASGTTLAAPTVEAKKLTTAGTVTTTTIDGEVAQSGGEIKETALETGLSLKNGAVTQTGGKVTATALTLVDSGAVSLAKDENEIAKVGGNASSVALTTSKSLDVAELSTGALSLKTTGKGYDITQSGRISAGETSLTGKNIALVNEENNFATFTSFDAAGDARIVHGGAGNLTIRGGSAAGDIRLESVNSGLTIAGANSTHTGVSGANVTLIAKDNILEGGDTANDYGGVNATGDKYVKSREGKIDISRAGTVGGDAAYDSAGAITIYNGETLRAGNGKTLYLKASSVSGKTGGKQEKVDSNGKGVLVEGSNANVEFSEGLATVTDATKVAADTEDALVVDNNNIALEIGEISASGATITEVTRTATKDTAVGGDTDLVGITAKSVEIDVGNAAVTVTEETKTTGGNIAITATKVTVNNSITAKNGTDGADIVIHGELDQAAGTITASTLTLDGDAGQSGGNAIATTLVLDNDSANIAMTSAANDFGTAQGTAAAIALKDANDIQLGTVTAKGNDGDVAVETVAGTITVNEGATVKSEKANVTLTANKKAAQPKADINVNGTVSAAKTAKLDADRSINVNGNIIGAAVDVDAANAVSIAAGKMIEATGADTGTDKALAIDAGGNVNVLGTAKAAQGTVAVKTTGATKSIKVAGANASVEGKSVSLDASAGKSVQVLNGASVTATAGDIVATAKEYIALAGTVEATDGDVELTTTDAETLTAAVGGYAAGAPAGILQLAGTVNGENVKLDSKGSISTAAGTTIQATDGNVAMTARGTSTESPAVTQGITLGGTTTAKTDVNLHAQNGSFKNTGTITATEGDVRIQAKDAVDINGAVAANARPVDSENKPIDTAGNIRISSTDGAVATTATVDGNNITVVAKKSAKLNAKATAARDIYVDSGEKLTVASTGAQAGETMALVSGKDIDAQNLNAATLYTKDETGATLNGLAVKDYKGESKGNVNLTFNGDTADGINVGLKTIGGDIDVTVNSGDATVAMDASGHANATVNGGTLTIDEVSAISGGALKVTEVKAFTAAIDANPGTQEKELIVANAEGGKVTGVTAGTSSTLTGKDVVVNKAVWAKAGNATITATTGDITVNGTTVKAGTFTVDEASGAVPVEKTGNLSMDAKKAVLIQTVEIEGTKYAAQVGASGTADIDSGVGGVTVTGKAADNTPTRLVANGAMTIDADGGAVTIENNATVASHDAITIGGDTTKDTKNVTVGKAVADGVDKSQLVSGKNLSVTASESILAQNTTKVGSDAMVTLSATGEGATVKVDAGALVIAEEKADVKAEKGSAEISGTVQGKTEAVVTAKTLVDVKESGVVKATADKGIASVSATGGNVEVSGTVEATGKGGEASVTAAQGTATVTKTGSVKADGEKGDGDKVAKATVSGKSVTIAAEGAAKGTVSAAKGEAAVEATAGKADIAGTVTAANKAEVKASGGDEEVNAVVSGTVTATADVGVASVESTDKNATISGTVKAEGERAKAEVAAATSATVTETGKVQADAKGATASVTGASAEVKVGGQVSAKKGEASVTATGEGGKATIAGMVKAEEGTASVKAENGSAEISGTVQGKTEASVTAKTLAEVKEFGVVKATADKGIASVSATGGNAKVSGTVEATGEKAKAGVAAATSVMVTETGKVQANGEGGDVVVDGKTGVTVAGTVKAADNVRVAAESGGVKVDGTVTAGNNATLEADAGDVTISKGKKVTATNGDVLAYAHDGNVIVKGNVSSTKGTTVLKADKADKKDKADKGNVKISSDATVKTKDLGIDASKAITITAPDKNLDVSGNAALKAANDITVKEVAGDISIAAKSTGGNVTIDIPGKVNILGDTTVAAKKVAADGSAKKTVKVNVNGLDAAGKAKIDASGISGASVKSDGDMTLTVKENGDYNVRNTDAKGDLVLTVGGNVGNKATVESITAGGNATMDVGKDIVSAENVTAGGAIDLDVDGNANVGTVGAKGEANLDIGGNLTAGTVSGSPVIAKVGGSTQVNAVNGGGVQVTSGGQAQFGSVTGGKVEIDAGGVKTTGAGIIKSTDLTVKSRGDIDVTLDSQKITSIDGRNVKITEKAANRDVTLGSVSASVDLDITAASIGIGTNGKNGYNDGNGTGDNLISGGDMNLNVAGRMGKASDPLDIKVGGKLTLDSGNLHGSNEDNPVAPNLSPISFFYLISTGEAPNMNDSWNQYVGAGKIPGLVIYKGQILAASPDLWLKINRALAFTIDTPELKSKQGVFGTPLFVHTDMDVSEAASIGSVDYVSIADTIMDTLADPDVNDRLIDIVEENDDPDLKRRFDIQRKNPLGRDALYSKEFKGK